MKKYQLKYVLALLVSAFVWLGCQEEVVETFDSESSLFFYEGEYNLSGDPQYGEFSYSFFYAESGTTRDSVWVDVRLTGLPVDEDRRISLVQLESEEEEEEVEVAVSGNHFVAFDDPELQELLVMPAGATSVLIPVVINKTADMETDEFTLEFGFESNDFFVSGLKEQASFVITMTALAVKPAGWDYYYDYTFGEWGSAKMKFLIDYVGFDDFTIDLSNPDYYRFFNLKARNALEEYEAEFGPIYESDGVTRVIFP